MYSCTFENAAIEKLIQFERPLCATNKVFKTFKSDWHECIWVEREMQKYVMIIVTIFHVNGAKVL